MEMWSSAERRTYERAAQRMGLTSATVDIERFLRSLQYTSEHASTPDLRVNARTLYHLLTKEYGHAD